MVTATLTEVLADLKRRRKLVEDAIEAIEQLKLVYADYKVPAIASPIAPCRRRKQFSDETRARMSEAQRRRWAASRAAVPE